MATQVTFRSAQFVSLSWVADYTGSSAKNNETAGTTHRMRRGSRRLGMWGYEYSFIFPAPRKAFSWLKTCRGALSCRHDNPFSQR
jgi:hypothetical protein